MTDDTLHIGPPAAPDAPKPYAAPALHTLGTIDAVTAGPNVGGGNIDQLFGGVGGFRTADTTS